jgi:hypothetical protein
MVLLATSIVCAALLLKTSGKLPFKADNTNADTSLDSLIKTKARKLTAVGTFSELARTQDRVYINTNQGEKELTNTNGSGNYQEISFDDYGLAKTAQSLLHYDYATQILTDFVLPTTVPYTSVNTTYITQINSRYAFFGFVPEESSAPSGTRPVALYLYDAKTKVFTRMRSMELKCDIVYCSAMPSFAAQIGDGDFLYWSGGGEACWRRGEVRILHAKSDSVTSVMPSSSGCGQTDDDDVLGLYTGKILAATRTRVMDRLGTHTFYNRLYLRDPYTGSTQTIKTFTTDPEQVLIALTFNSATNTLAGSTQQEASVYYKLVDTNLQDLTSGDYAASMREQASRKFIKTVKVTIRPKKPYTLVMDRVNLYLTDANAQDFLVSNTGTLKHSLGKDFDSRCSGQNGYPYWEEFKEAMLVDNTIFFTLTCAPMHDKTLPVLTVFDNLLGMLDLANLTISLAE